jgi:hypothetical protein
MSHLYRASVLWIAALLVVVSIPPLQAAGRQDIIAQFQAGDLEMIIYTQEEQDSVARYTIAHLGIANGSLHHIFAFNPGEWERLIILYREAASAQSRDWKIVGSITETGTGDTSHLTVSAGPGVRFVVASLQLGAPVAYDLSRSEMSRFEQALYSVRQSLSR